MRFSEIIFRMNNLESDGEVALYFKALRQNSIIWQGFKNLTSESPELNSLTNKGQPLNAGTFALVAFDPDFDFEMLSDSKFAPELLEQIMFGYEDYLLSDAPIESIGKAGRIALALLAKYKDTGSWNDVILEILERKRFTAGEQFELFWLPILIVTLNLVEDKRHFLKELLDVPQTGMILGSLVHLVLSIPVPDEEKIDILRERLYQLDEPIQVTALRILKGAGGSEFAGRVSAKLLEKYRNIDLEARSARDYWKDPALSTRFALQCQAVADIADLAGENEFASLLNDKALAILAALVKKGKVKKAGINWGTNNKRDLNEIFDSEDLYDPDIQAELIYSSVDAGLPLDGLVHPVKTIQQAKKLIQAGNSELAAEELRTNFDSLTDGQLEKMMVDGPDQIQTWEPDQVIQSLLDIEAYDAVNRISRILLHENPSSVQGNLAAAIGAEGTGDYQSAVNYWEALTLLQPESVDYKRNLVKSLDQSGKRDEAFEISQQMVDRKEDANIEDLVKHAELALLVDKPVDALRAADRIVEVEPEHTRGLTLAGLAHRKSGDLINAEGNFRCAMTASAGDVRPWIELADLQWSSGKEVDAISTLNEGIAANPGNRTLQTELVKRMMVQGLISESFPILATLSKNGENLDVDLLLIEAMDALGIEGVDEQLEMMVERYPNDERFLADYGKRLIWSGDNEKGFELLNRLGEKVHTKNDWKLAYTEAVNKPDYRELTYERKIPNDELRKTTSFLDEYLSEDVENCHAKLLKAETLLMARDVEASFQLFSELNKDNLGKQNLDHARLLAGLAQAAAANRELDIARAAVEQAMSIQTDWHALRAIKARIFHLSGDESGAVSQVHDALAEAPQTAENQVWAIRFLQDINHPDEASGLLTEAVSKYPNHLGLCVLSAQNAISEKNNAGINLDGDHLFVLLQETTDPDVLVDSAVIFAELEDGARTQWCLEKAAQLGSAEAMFNLAGLFRINKNLAEARQTLAQIESHPGLVNLLETEISFSSGDNEQLSLNYSEIGFEEPEIQFCDVFLPEEWREILDSSRPVISLGVKIASLNGNYAGVITDVKRWIDENPKDAEARVQGIELALAAGDHALYDQLLSMSTQDLEGSLANQVFLLAREGLLDRADSTELVLENAELFESIKSDEPEKITLIREMRQVGRLAQAETTFEMANGVFSKLNEKALVVKIGILRNLAKGAIALDRWTEAMQLLDTLVNLAPANNSINILRLRAATRGLEFHNRAQNLGVTAHNYTDVIEFCTGLQQELDEIQITASSQEDLKHWRTRLELALNPDKAHIRKLAELTPDAENAAAMMAGLHATGQTDTALKVCRKFAENPLVLYQAALCEIDRKPDSALEWLQKSLTLDPHQPLALRLQSFLLEQKSSLSESVNLLEQALEYWPNESKWRLDAADQWKRLGNTERPLEHLQIASLYNPQNVEIRRLFGRALLSAGKKAQALSHLVMVVESKPDDYDTWIALSELYQGTGDLELALQAANRAAEVDSKGVKAHLQAARVSWLKGETRKAEEQAKTALTLDSEDPEIYVFLARLSKEQGNKVSALELLEKAAGSKAASLNTVIEHANLINEINGAVAARDLIAAFSQKYPENPDLLLLLAEAETQCGDTRNAETAAKKALEIKPEENAIHMLLGRILENNGNLDQAVHHYSQAISLEPMLIEGYLKLSQVYIKQREFLNARKVLEQGISKVPGNIDLYLSCAALLKESKDYHGAEKMLRKASTIDPRNISVHRQLGAILALNMVHQSQEVGSQV